VQVSEAIKPIPYAAGSITPVLPDEAAKTLTIRMSSPSPAALLATLSQVVTSIGAPSKTSGHQKWNGAAEILNAIPTSTAARASSGSAASPPAATWAAIVGIFSVP